MEGKLESGCRWWRTSERVGREQALVFGGRFGAFARTMNTDALDSLPGHVIRPRKALSSKTPTLNQYASHYDLIVHSPSSVQSTTVCTAGRRVGCS